jgi:alkylhydroperoxidase family enzyme
LEEQFSEREMVDLSLAISAMNSWKRLAARRGAQPPAA